MFRLSIGVFRGYWQSNCPIASFRSCSTSPGRPIQYSYLAENLEVWDQQTPFAGPPISVEPPSASFPLSWDLLLRSPKRDRNRDGLARCRTFIHRAMPASTASFP